jgi:NADH:ubiquinone oxidoreductase subunit F (NADH-binding)
VVEGRRQPVVVVNGSEGEPASAKDGKLLTACPHLVLDGALWAAAAVGAREVIVCIERDKEQQLRAVETAVRARINAREPMIPISICDIPNRYVAGEETALVHFINGGEARPTLTPPRPYQRGVAGVPTLINNVETLCHFAQIIRWGPLWFRGLGTADEPGTMLLTLSGAVRRRGVCEIPIGMPMSTVIQSAEPTHELKAVLLGGFYGTWVGADEARRATLDNAHLRSIGSALGCGALIALPTSACGVLETARVLTWLAGETAGQCGPCVHGLAAIAGAMTELAMGSASADTIATLHRWAGQIEGRGACSYPDGAVRLLRSALKVFDSDIARHLDHRPCVAAWGPGFLNIPATHPGGWR